MNSLLCRLKDKFEYFVASKETASEILDKIGFGETKCKETYEKDKRYGYADENEIKYGFENSMYGNIPFGHCVVCDYYFDDCYGYTIRNEQEFKEEFEKCE